MELSRFLHKLLEDIIKKIENNQLTNKELCSILDGILNAEGSADIDQEKRGIHKTTISFNQHCQKEKELFSKILEKLNLLKYSRIEQEKRFTFSKWINNYKFIRKFVKNNFVPFSLYPKRAERLCRGFLNHQRTNSIRKYLEIIKERDKQNLKNIAERLGYDKTSVEEAILRKFKPF